MPIHRKISHLDHMVVGVSYGVVTLVDIGDFLDVIVRARARPYRKLFDASEGTSGLSAVDLAALATRLHAAPKPQPLGPFAVVTRPHREELTRILRPFASLERPMRIFRDIHAARRWLEHQPPMI
jgi:hypothetical protein